MKVLICREEGYRDQEYCVLEFKGKFETEDLPSKSLVHLGSLQSLGNDQFRLEVGVMDLLGKATPLEQGWLYSETQQGDSPQEKRVLVRGVVTKKILFDRRPCPNMERSETEPRMTATNHLFKNLEIRGTH